MAELLPGMPLFVGRQVRVLQHHTEHDARLLSSADVTFHWRAFTGWLDCEGLASTATEPLRKALQAALIARERLHWLVVVDEPLEVYWLNPYVASFRSQGWQTGAEHTGSMCGILTRFQARLAVDEPPFAELFDQRQLLPRDHPDFQAMFASPPPRRKGRPKRTRATRRQPSKAQKE